MKRSSIVLIAVLAVLLSACNAPVPPVTSAFDAAPSPVPDLKQCAITGDADVMTLVCSPMPTPEPTAIPTAAPTPTPSPAFWYFQCNGDSRCASGQYRVFWRRDLTDMRCALPVGDKVTVIVFSHTGRTIEEGEPIAWVVTGADAGGVPCEGWVPMTFLRAAA